MSLILQPVGGSAFLLYIQLDPNQFHFLEPRRQCRQYSRLGHLWGRGQLLQGQWNQITGLSLLKTVLSLIHMGGF